MPESDPETGKKYHSKKWINFKATIYAVMLFFNLSNLFITKRMNVLSVCLEPV